MGIPTLISTATASNDSAVSITSGIDSTYDEYMFVFTDIGPATDNVNFSFQGNVASGSGYNETMTTTLFRAQHDEADSDTDLAYITGQDQAQGTAFQLLGGGLGNGADESLAGILHLFTPSNTTYVTHFYSTIQFYHASNYSLNAYVAGYFNLTGAIDEIQFKMSSGNFDDVIQLFGIS